MRATRIFRTRNAFPDSKAVNFTFVLKNRARRIFPITAREARRIFSGTIVGDAAPSHRAIFVTLILDPRNAYLITRLAQSLRKHACTDTPALVRSDRSSRQPSLCDSFRPMCDSEIWAGEGLISGRSSRLKFAGPDRSIASDRGIRCRTLRIARGKENVETARGTRHTIASRVAVCGRAALRLCVHMYLDWLLLTQPQTTVVVQSGKMHATRSAVRVRIVSFDNAHALTHACVWL